MKCSDQASLSLKRKSLERLIPLCEGIGPGTVKAALSDRLEELDIHDYVQGWVPGTWHDTDTCYELSDRLYNENGDYIGHTLIDTEWPERKGVHGM